MSIATPPPGLHQERSMPASQTQWVSLATGTLLLAVGFGLRVLGEPVGALHAVGAVHTGGVVLRVLGAPCPSTGRPGFGAA